MTSNIKHKSFLEDAINGLSNDPKSLPCKYFYDQSGSDLFVDICQQPEYYITRTEIALLQSIGSALSDYIGENAHIIEPGSGAGEKIQILLKALKHPASYIPIDIALSALEDSCKRMRARFPNIHIQSLQYDFTQPMHMSAIFDELELCNKGHRVVFFPGSTIGNFVPADATLLLKRFANAVKKGGFIIIGVDLLKGSKQLEAAYNDKAGVTAAFNKNILVRLESEYGATIDLDAFEHEAVFNQSLGRIEMYLKSVLDQTILLGEKAIQVQKNERIHTENSYKYSITQFQALAKQAGLQPIDYWKDDADYFSVHLLKK